MQLYARMTLVSSGRCDHTTRRPDVEVVSNYYFSDESVTLDGKHFVDCTLVNCELTYCGGAMVFERTRISGCSYMFGEHAQRTVNLLKIVGLLGHSFSVEIDAQETVN